MRQYPASPALPRLFSLSTGGRRFGAGAVEHRRTNAQAKLKIPAQPHCGHSSVAPGLAPARACRPDCCLSSGTRRPTALVIPAHALILSHCPWCRALSGFSPSSNVRVLKAVQAYREATLKLPARILGYGLRLWHFVPGHKALHCLLSTPWGPVGVRHPAGRWSRDRGPRSFSLSVAVDSVRWVDSGRQLRGDSARPVPRA